MHISDYFNSINTQTGLFKLSESYYQIVSGEYTVTTTVFYSLKELYTHFMLRASNVSYFRKKSPKSQRMYLIL